MRNTSKFQETYLDSIFFKYADNVFYFRIRVNSNSEILITEYAVQSHCTKKFTSFHWSFTIILPTKVTTPMIVFIVTLAETV